MKRFPSFLKKDKPATSNNKANNSVNAAASTPKAPSKPPQVSRSAAAAAATPRSAMTPTAKGKEGGGVGTPEGSRRKASAAVAKEAAAAAANKGAAAAATAASKTKQQRSPGEAPEESDSCDVLVIGAGVSGLVAASELAHRDPTLRVKVLEARDRVGGRLHTVKAKIGGEEEEETALDMGGQVFRSDQKPVLQLLDQLQLRHFPLAEDAGCYSVFWVGRGADGGAGGAGSGRGNSRPMRMRGSSSSRGLLSWLRSADLSRATRRLRALAQSVDQRHPYKDRRLARELDSTSVHSYLRSLCYYQFTVDALELGFRTLSGGHDPASVSMLFFALLLASASQSGSEGEKEGLPLPGVASSACTRSPSPSYNIAIEGGAEQMCTRLASRLGRTSPPGSANDSDCAVVLGQWVQSIAFAGGEADSEGEAAVTAVDSSTGRRRRWRCRRVIVAAPPQCLAAIRVEPTLPDAAGRAAAAFTAGEMVKFAAVYERPFWREGGFSGGLSCLGGKQMLAQCEGLPLNLTFDATVYEVGDKNKAKAAKGKAVLSGILTCEKSLQWSQVSSDTLRHAVAETLSEACGGATWPSEMLHFEVENWSRQRSLGGSGGAPGLASMAHFHALRQPMGLLHLAGAETAALYTGQVAGAILSGRRSALQALQALRPQTLSPADLASLRDSSVDPAEELQAIRDAVRSSEADKRWIYRWTFVMPMCGLMVGYAAYAFRDKYSSLFVPIHH